MHSKEVESHLWIWESLTKFCLFFGLHRYRVDGIDEMPQWAQLYTSRNAAKRRKTNKNAVFVFIY